MNTLIQADIFFFITTIAVVLITIGVCIALFYIVRLVRDVEQSFILTKKRVSDLAENIDEVKNELLESPVIQLITSFAQKKRRKKYAKENNE